MTIKERVDIILSRPMDRNQFLKQAGLLVLAMVGITSLLNVLDPKQQKQSASTANGPSYGASVYGGGKK